MIRVIFYIIFKYLLKIKNVIVFETFDGTSQGLYERTFFESVYAKYNDQYRFVWINKEQDDTLPKDVIQVRSQSIKSAKWIAKARHMFSGTFSKVLFLKKKTNFYYINHGYNVKTMGSDWAKERGKLRIMRTFLLNNSLRQVTICFAHNEFDKKCMIRTFKCKGSSMRFVINGFPKIECRNKTNKTNDKILFLPSWHETKEIQFPELPKTKKFVSFHPRVKKKNTPANWEEITKQERAQKEFDIIISDNSASIIEYIANGYFGFWIEGKYDRDFCNEFKQKYKELIIKPNNFKKATEFKKEDYFNVVKDIVNAPKNDESMKISMETLKEFL